VVFAARQMIFDVIGDLFADRCQRTQFGFDERIDGPLDKFPIRGCLIPQIIQKIMRAEHGAVELRVVTIHGGAFARRSNA
jgi:hypothetical protein